MTDAVIFKTKGDAAIPRAPLPPDRPRKRRPLGLRPDPGDDDRAAEAPPAGEDRFADPAIGLVVESGELLLGVLKDTQRHFERKIAGLENAYAKLVNENTDLRLILENLRVTQRGERGIDGDRGAPGAAGRDGLQGPIGPRGERGERGKPAPTIAAFEPHPERFEIVPRYSTGDVGPPIALLSLFQAYDSAVQELEDRDIVSAAADARQTAEDAAEASRWAMR